MFVYPDIDPVALKVGPLAVHWYGIMYLISFIGGYWLLSRRARSTGLMAAEQVGDLIFYLALGVVLGGRVGYCLFYAPDLFIEFSPHIPWWGVLKITQGGMSFHGGLIGVIIAELLFCRKYRINWLDLADFVAPAVPLGLFCGRIGNFINGELWGRVTDVPWGMVFPQAGSKARHPSMLYEAALEGVVLFVILWWFSSKPRPRMAVGTLFLIGYGAFRFLVEFVRQPDAQLGFIAFDWLTMGHLLSLPMIVVGVVLMICAYRKPVYSLNTKASHF
ncbi:MAG TPA: prolipoprotein diacylglyceryl transferase [Gammaproteobacteria bacterium]|nr:prolipoprotein diacylglyceryl transferase [Gammaproteobacteria bacterium]